MEVKKFSTNVSEMKNECEKLTENSPQKTMIERLLGFEQILFSSGFKPWAGQGLMEMEEKCDLNYHLPG